jgi:hypothetical protein
MVGGMKRFGAILNAIVTGRQPTLASGSLRLAGVVAAVAVVGSLGSCGSAESPPPPVGEWLEQNWTPEVRQAYHHESQGTATLPIPAPWFLALEQPDGSGLFSDPANLETFGFIRSERNDTNPDGLPIGFARTRGTNPRLRAPNNQIDQIGFTCAACHTGLIEHDGHTLLIDGGPAMTNLSEFRDQLGEAVKRTALDVRVFHRFADRVVGPPTSLERIRDRTRLARALARRIVEGLILALTQKHASAGSIEEGFGRLDALNRIGNQVFGVGMGIAANYAPTNAPVAYPHIWDTSWFDWVQYNSSIMQPMVRNAGEAMGVGALVNYKEGPTPRFTSTIPVDRLHGHIEARLAGATQPMQNREFTGLRSPAWPAEILGQAGQINQQLVEDGAALYRENCQVCHLPAPNTPEFWAENNWSPASDNSAGERFLRVRRIPIERVGTDPGQAVGMANRRVWVPASLGLLRHDATQGAGPGELRRYKFGDALGQLVEKVTNRWYDSHNTPEADRQRMNGNRPNLLQDWLIYKARPLNGIWATGPFLHNGSVPTLMDLLSPYAERNRHCAADRGAMRCILLYGNREFDPQRVGYRDGGTFRLDTRIAGNLNTGHLFDGPPGITLGQRPPGVVGRSLSPDERRALIEYLKTL